VAGRSADWKVGDTADWKVCATGSRRAHRARAAETLARQRTLSNLIRGDIGFLRVLVLVFVLDLPWSFAHEEQNEDENEPACGLK
jgi:hypothetical protein